MEKKYRKAVFAVAYSKTPEGNVEYIILKRKKHWKGWEFPKGKIEKGETKKQTVIREVYEETGLKSISVKSFGIKGEYKYKKTFRDRPGIVGQTFELFSVEVPKGKISIDSKEHYSGKWASKKDALKKLTWPNQRRCLRIVDKWLNGKE